jgi:transposase
VPDEPPKPKGARPRVDDRSALAGIIFVLKSGIPWETLPQEMGCGSGLTCWRRLREWQEAGVWERLHKVLLDRLGEADRIDWEARPLYIGRNVGFQGRRRGDLRAYPLRHTPSVKGGNRREGE